MSVSSGALSSLLAITSSGSMTAFYLDFYAISNIASPSRNTCRLDLSLKAQGTPAGLRAMILSMAMHDDEEKP